MAVGKAVQTSTQSSKPLQTATSQRSGSAELRTRSIVGSSAFVAKHTGQRVPLTSTRRTRDITPRRINKTSLVAELWARWETWWVLSSMKITQSPDTSSSPSKQPWCSHLEWLWRGPKKLAQSLNSSSSSRGKSNSNILRQALRWPVFKHTARLFRHRDHHHLAPWCRTWSMVKTSLEEMEWTVTPIRCQLFLRANLEPINNIIFNEKIAKQQAHHHHHYDPSAPPVFRCFTRTTLKDQATKLNLLRQSK